MVQNQSLREPGPARFLLKGGGVPDSQGLGPRAGPAAKAPLPLLCKSESSSWLSSRRARTLPSSRPLLPGRPHPVTSRTAHHSPPWPWPKEGCSASPCLPLWHLEGLGLGADTQPSSNPRRGKGLRTRPHAPSQEGPAPHAGWAVMSPTRMRPSRPSRPALDPALEPAGSRRALSLPARCLPGAGSASCQHPRPVSGVREQVAPEWSVRQSRSLTQKMKLNPNSRYLMHLVPPLTGMVRANLAWVERVRD